MATMVARGSSPLASSISIQEKGSRNKRKFRADPPITDLSMIQPSMSQTDSPNYELFPPSEKPLENPNHQLGMCDLCQTSIYGGTRDELESEDSREADWSETMETQLEEILLGTLDAIFKTAIKMIVSYGYSEEVAINAVLISGISYGGKDTVSNIVENALGVLRSGQEVNSCLRENAVDELKELERSMLVEMVSVVRDVRSFFSMGDAMWHLLICDMNVSHACAVDCNPLNSVGSEDVSASVTAPQVEQESNSQTTNELNSSSSSKLNPMLPHPQNSLQPEMPAVVGIPNLPSGRFSSSANAQPAPIASVSQAKESAFASLERAVVESSSLSISQSSTQEVKPSGSKKIHSSARRESMMRQKVHLEKSYRAYGSKATLRAAKHSGLGGLLVDKKNKSISDSNAMNMKNALMKLNKAVGTDVPQVDPTLNLSFTDGPVKPINSTPLPPLPIANTELSLSLPSTSSSSNSIAGGGIETGLPPDKMCGHWILQDQKDEMLVKLVPRARELQALLLEWSEWAQHKVKQATQRLSKEKPELQSLRQEKEEVARLKKEKQTLEENTRKKLAEMEIALSKASGQVERANAAARRLEVENSELRKEMEAAKLRAAESAASCQEVSRRETKTLKKFQSWDRQKAVYQEELVNEKRKFCQLQQQLEQAKEHRDQIQARWKQEEKAKDEAITQGNTERKEREQIEVSGRAKENALKLKAENDLQRYKEDIKRLEQQIAQLRLRTDSSKIAALKWGTDGSYASRLSDARKENDAYVVPNLMDFQELGSEEVQRDRECVMCLTEEMSVVFLPCAHQVVCAKCNELHEKQGMKDCPSCRTPIKQRICVRSAGS